MSFITDEEKTQFGATFYNSLTKAHLYTIYVGLGEIVSQLVPSGHHGGWEYFRTLEEQMMFAQFINLAEEQEIVPV